MICISVRTLSADRHIDPATKFVSASQPAVNRSRKLRTLLYIVHSTGIYYRPVHPVGLHGKFTLHT
jgi:hypothetical protein